MGLNVEDKKDLVVKTNRLIEALQTLSLVETRLVQLAIIDARETGRGITERTPLSIHASRYADALGVSLDAAYKAMLVAEKTLFDRQFTFMKDGDKIRSHWVSQVKYIKGEPRIELMFTPAVVDEITRLDGYQDSLTSYAFEKTADLTSVYAVRLYELLIQWKSTGGKPPIFKLDIFREQLGVGVNEYKAMCDFKKAVLDLAVNQINKSKACDITVSYEQHKDGRVITGFSFKFKQKTKRVNAPVKTKKPEPNKALSAFAGLQLVLLKQIKKIHPEITEQYVSDYAEKTGLDIVQVLEKIKTDYKSAEEFSLEKTD